MTFPAYNDSTLTYDDAGAQYGGLLYSNFTISGVQYRIIFRKFSKDSVGGVLGSFAPGDILAEIENAKNIGWAYYVNDVPEMFFTVNQDDPKLASIKDYLDGKCIVELYRNAELVWAGWPLEFDETQNDVIIYAYGYAAGLYWLHTGWGTEWTDKGVNTIVNDVMSTAIVGAASSLVHWLRSGAIEIPVTESDGATALTLPLYKVYYKRILFVLKELVAVSASDTTNRVWFEVTPNGVWNLYKDKGRDLTAVRFEYPGLVQGFRRHRVPASRRNVILGVGSSPDDVVLQSTQDDIQDRADTGRREEAIYLSWVRDQSELDRVSKMRLKRALRVESEVGLRLAKGSVDPYPASTAIYSLMDTIPVKIDQGVTQLDDSYLITGQQVLFMDGEEQVIPLIQDKLI